jgi:hypothetical protein
MLNKALQSASASAEKIYIESVFSTYLYTGNGSTQTITNGIDLAGEGGLVWFKQRNGTQSNVVQDTARGNTKYLMTNATDAEYSVGSNYISSFNSDGFSLGAGSLSTNGNTYASWTFRKAEKFFDVVTFAKTTDNQVVNHSLGTTPGFVLIKSLDAGQWWAFHGATSGGLTGGYLVLNSTAAFNADGRFLTGATSTTITVGEQSNGQTYVAYLFAHDAGGFGDTGNDSVVKCGSFTTDGSGNIGTVSLGWEPQWILTKRTDSTQAWYMWDSMRGMSLTSGSTLSPNNADAEVVMGSTSYLYPTATGFAGSGNFYGPNATVAYIAIRRGPMKTPTDATKVFKAITSISAPDTSMTVGFPADMYLATRTGETISRYVQDRLRGFANTNASGTPNLFTDSAVAEATNQSVFAYNLWNTTAIAGNQTGNANSLWYYFRRAPGFMDVVAYTGDGTNPRNISHNLGVIPEFIVVKNRGGTNSWFCYAAAIGNTDYVLLNSTAAKTTFNLWGNTTPTSSVFTVSNSGVVNGPSTYIAYLFATCPGVSKVGSYTGTGTTLSVDCGFTNGARFVLIKRTDSTGDWYVWDTARGIVSGNDPYLLLNSTAAEVTNTDYIDPLSSGFQISSTAPAAINANGGSFIFLAIA